MSRLLERLRGQSPSRSPTASPTRSPSLSPKPGGTARGRSNSTQLQSQVESERQEVLTNVKDTHAEQFNAVDSLSHRLENTTSSALDMFKRDVPATIDHPLTTDDSFPTVVTGSSSAFEDSSSPHLTSSSIVITSPTSAMPATKAALGNATLLKTVELPDTEADRTLSSEPVVETRAEATAATAAALEPVVEQHAEQFAAVDTLSQKLEDTTNHSLDMFIRDLPDVVGGRQSSEVTTTAATAATTTATTITTTAPTSGVTWAAPVAATSALGGATLVKTVTLADTPEDRTLSSSTSSSSSSTVPSPRASPRPVLDSFPVSAALSPMVAKRSPVLTVSDDRERRDYLRGVEKDTAIAPPVPAGAERDQQIAALSMAVIASKQAYQELADRLYASDVGASLLGADARSTATASQSTLLSTIGSDDRSLQSFLHDLPVQRGWLMLRNAATANVPASFTKKYASLSYDGLVLSDNDQGLNAQKTDISRYWLIERTGDRSSSAANYATGAQEIASPASPVAGKSVFRLEDGAYVLRLVPIVTDVAHPQMVLEPSKAEILEFTGANEADIANPDALTAWVDALNLRISLLSLLAYDQHAQLMARGGREVLTFLCSLSSSTLLIENKLVEVGVLLSYFKEPLIHRRNFSIVLRNVAMDDAGARGLSELLMLNHHIQHVDVSANVITDTGASYLATSLEVNHSLVSLHLDHNHLGQEGVLELVTALAQSKTLTSLSLRGNRIDDATLQAMVQVLREGVPRVFTKVDLSWNELTDASAEAIGALLGAFSVASLNVSHNRLGDTVPAAINAALSTGSSSLTSLSLLDLSHNSLTSACATALSILLSRSMSLSVKLSGNALSAASVVSLLSSGIELSVEELRVKKADSRPALGRRLSITKETVRGKVELIDPLNPANEKQLGRHLDELHSSAKKNVLDHDETKSLEVPATAAATELLVDGGKTADPRS